MIIKNTELKDVCTKILTAVDSTEVSTLTETLQLKTEGTYLYFSVTNKEYFAQVKIDIGETVDFHATVKANLFLKLIPQITTDTIELTVTNSSLNIVGNGKYKLPLIYDGDNKLLELPEIEIKNVTNDFYVNSNVLMSINQYNSKELQTGAISRPVQKFYYVDDEGAITFTTGACVNSFTLSQPVKLLLNSRLVKLFKLFKEGDVHFTVGYDAISDEITQPKVRFETEDTKITASLSCSTDALIKTVPVASIRGRASKAYPYTVTCNKEELQRSIGRLLLFISSASKSYAKFEFDKDRMTIYDVNEENKETIYYTGTNNTIPESYSLVLDLTELKLALDPPESDVTMLFGDSQAVVISMGAVKNILPEVKLSNL